MMRARFNHNNHSIVIERGLTGAQLYIDNQLCAKKSGAFSVQLKNFELSGEIPNPNGTVDQVCIAVRVGLVQDDVVFFLNGKEMDSQKVRA